MKLEYLIAILTIGAVLTYGSFNYLHKSHTQQRLTSSSNATIPKRIYYNNEDDVVAYIIDVINNGSNRLKVSKEPMEGGYIPKDKARDVACYVYELSGRKCSHKYSKDAAMYFSSSCAGCHGNDGKGINGAYPNLTKNPLLGVKGLKEKALF